LETYFKGDIESKLTDHLDMGQIIMSLVFTSCFYFPGFIHALHIMKNKDKCGSVF
jgi:hypothetical protein